MDIVAMMRSWATQFEKDRSAPLAEASAMMLSAANEIVNLRSRLAAERTRCADIANLYASQARPCGDEDVGDCPLTAYFDGQRLVAQNIEHDIKNGN